MGSPVCPVILAQQCRGAHEARNIPRPSRLWVSWMRAGRGQRSIRMRESVQVGAAGSAPDLLAIVSYMHGGGWVPGSRLGDDRLVRELCCSSRYCCRICRVRASSELRSSLAPAGSEGEGHRHDRPGNDAARGPRAAADLERGFGRPGPARPERSPPAARSGCDQTGDGHFGAAGEREDLAAAGVDRPSRPGLIGSPSCRCRATSTTPSNSGSRCWTRSANRPPPLIPEPEQLPSGSTTT